MSYNCEISFKEICAEEVYDFLVTLKNKLIDNIKNIAKDNYLYAPFVTYQFKPYTKLENYSEIEHNNSWVKQVFTYRYFYLKEYNLLGIYGLPNSVQDLFDDTIYFQNSTDQDYDLTIWDKIKLFKNVAVKWKNCTNNYIIQTQDCDENDDIEYNRRSGCYSEIWDTYVKKTLFNDDSVVHFSCFGYYDLLHIQKFIGYCEQQAIQKGFIMEDDKNN